jgi:hypothetical protein
MWDVQDAVKISTPHKAMILGYSAIGRPIAFGCFPPAFPILNWNTVTAEAKVVGAEPTSGFGDNFAWRRATLGEEVTIHLMPVATVTSRRTAATIEANPGSRVASLVSLLI